MASNKFPGKLSELFLVLADSQSLAAGATAGAGDSGPSHQNRGRKHQLDNDQMSTESTHSKRKDLSTSAEKKKTKPGKNKATKNK